MSLPLSKFNFSEGCDKLKDQYNLLSVQFNNLKNESEKLRNEKNNVSKHYGFYYEVSCALNCELHRYMDGLRRINLACTNILPHLPQEQQSQMNQIIDFIKHMSNNDTFIGPISNGDIIPRTAIPINGTTMDHGFDINGTTTLNVNSENPHAEENIFEGEMAEPKAKFNDTTSSIPNNYPTEPSSSTSSSINNKEPSAGNDAVIKSSNGTNNIHENSTTQLINSSQPTKRDLPSNPIYNINFPPPPPPPPPPSTSYHNAMNHFQMYGELHPHNLSLQQGVPSMGYGMIPPANPLLGPSPLQIGPNRATGAHINSFDAARYGRPAAFRPPPNYMNNMGYPIYNQIGLNQSQKNSPPPPQFEYNLPKAFSKIAVLPHGDVVCTVTTTNDRLAITGGKGSIKIWDISKHTATAELVGTVDCLVDKYIRSCKTTHDGKVVVAGEANYIGIFDLGMVRKSQTLIGPNNLIQLDNNTNACYALALSPDGRLCYGGCSNGFVIVWDIVSNKLIRAYYGHTDGISCLDISSDGTKLYTGSLDKSAKVWDLRDGKLLEHYTYNAQVYAIASIPNNEWLCAGLENSLIDVSSRANERFELELHKSSVLSLRVAPTFDWMISVGKDNIVNCIRTPYGPPIYQIVEESSVLCCDISPDSKWIITGSSDRKASVYELQY